MARAPGLTPAAEATTIGIHAANSYNPFPLGPLAAAGRWELCVLQEPKCNLSGGIQATDCLLGGAIVACEEGSVPQGYVLM